MRVTRESLTEALHACMDTHDHEPTIICDALAVEVLAYIGVLVQREPFQSRPVASESLGGGQPPSDRHDPQAGATTMAGSKLLSEIDGLGYDGYDAGRVSFGSWERAVAAIEDEAFARGRRHA